MSEFSTFASFLEAWQEIEKFARAENIHPIFYQDAVLHWRTRAKLAVRGTHRSPKIGLFKEGTHDVIDMVQCPMHHPRIDSVLAFIRASIPLFRVSPYDENTHTGDLRYVQIQVQRDIDKVQLTVVLNHETLPNYLIPWLQHLSQFPEIFSLWINCNKQRSNTIFGKKWQHYSGEFYLWEKIGRRKLCFHPACFSQAHLGAFERLIESIQHKIKKAQRVLELYAGVGAIGLNIVEESREIALREIHSLASICFQESLKHLQATKKIDFKTADALDCLEEISEAQVLIVDPPRKGLPHALLEAINASSSLNQMFYVSCNFASFLRDWHVLLHQWKMTHLEGYLFFPGTKHIEVLGVFEKNFTSFEPTTKN